MAEQKDGGVQPTARSQQGYAIRDTTAGGYFDINGIGDWSFAGDVTLCEIFGSVTEAEQCIVDNHLDEDECEVVGIVRSIACVVFEREKGGA